MRNHIINIKSRLSGIQIMNEQLAKMCKEWEISKDVAFSMNLALEEIVTNIINHGYNGKEDCDITIRFSLEARNLRIQIKDGAHAFNPLDVAEPTDLDKPLEERNIGGLGIHLVKKFTDNFSYRRNNNKNIITILKSLEHGD
ncbi:MAG: ATP-binding protein [Bacteroidales bacterium]|nr:ATP-binding protein [Bacteroidales bacterium]